MNIQILGHETCVDSCISKSSTKCKIIGTSNCKPSFMIEDYPIYQINNVESVGVYAHQNYGWSICSSNEHSGLVTDYYFCIDGIYHEAWSHWVEESAIYLPLFMHLRKLYPQLKIYSFGKKGYKNAMYKAFNIKDEDIVYTISNIKNIFLFPYYISLGDHRNPFLFFKHLKIFYNYISSRCSAVEKDIEILYLPRGSKENCRENDRLIPVQQQLIEFLSGQYNVNILFTDSTENMIDQWSIVRRAKVIILNEGSSLLVNGFFSVNADILVLGGEGNHAHLWNPSPALAYYDSIHRGNKYYYIPYEWPIQYVLSLLSSVLNKMIPPEPIPRFKCYLDCNYCKYQDFEEYSIDKSVLLK